MHCFSRRSGPLRAAGAHIGALASLLACATVPATPGAAVPTGIDGDARADTAVSLTAGTMTLRVHVDESVAALAVIAAPSDSAARRPWARARLTEAYRRLHDREADMGRAFTDSEFFAYLRSDATRAQEPTLRGTFARWRTADLAPAVEHASAYLPPSAPIRASLYFMIKPHPNTFVYDLGGNPAIFVAIDTSISGPEFTNEVAHELHHVGYNSACSDAAEEAGSPEQRAVRHWMSAFGEGWAMLAAAGGPNVHPHATSDSATRARWDRDFADTPAQMRQLEQFFLDVLQGRLVGDDSIRQRAIGFFGVQGAWYTVGYLMARTIELTSGRRALLDVLCDPVAMMREYNRAATGLRGRGQQVPLWSDRLMTALGP